MELSSDDRPDTNKSNSRIITNCGCIMDEFTRVFFGGGSSFDAWLTASTAQIAQVLLVLPHSFAQMGMAQGIIFQIVFGLMGCWSCYMTTSLYADYIRIVGRQDNHIIQWYEVLGGLLGRNWKIISLFFNSALIICHATIQLVACSSTVWYINDNLDKRTWTYIFGAICCLTIFIPTARNYRLWVFTGIFMTTYTAWYMTYAAIVHDKVVDVKHSGPTSSVQYFTGVNNILYTFGSHAITLEIMDAMRKPNNYKVVYFYAILYTFTLTLPSATAVYWRFGDVMTNQSNALAVFPPSKFKCTAIVLMLAHQFIEFAAFALPAFVMWEKLLGIHHSKSYILKSVLRIPVVSLICFIAVMLPFFGTINSVVGSLLSSIAVYILPCLAFMVVRLNPESRKNAIEQPPRWIPNWVLIYCLNFGLVCWVALIGVGFGTWASIRNLAHKIRTFGLFTKCYQCT